MAREAVAAVRDDAEVVRAYGALRAVAEGHACVFKNIVGEEELRVGGLLVPVAGEPKVVLLIEAIPTADSSDVSRLRCNARLMDVVLEEDNPFSLVDVPFELRGFYGARVVPFLMASAFDAEARDEALAAGVVPVLRSGVAFALDARAPLPLAEGSAR